MPEANPKTDSQTTSVSKPIIQEQKATAQENTGKPKVEERPAMISKPKDTVRVANNLLFGSYVPKKK